MNELVFKIRVQGPFDWTMIFHFSWLVISKSLFVTMKIEKGAVLSGLVWARYLLAYLIGAV